MQGLQFRAAVLLFVSGVGAGIGCGGKVSAVEAVEDTATPAEAPAPAPVSANPPAVDYSFTTNQTTSFGPAQADILLDGTNWIPCTGTFSLCYYSGPVKPAADGYPSLPCTLSDDPNFANCRCIVSEGAYQVDVNAILDAEVYAATTASTSCCVENQGAWDCGGCEPNEAAVCSSINAASMYGSAKYDSVSTFSAFLGKGQSEDNPYAIRPTNCESARYAGCMTAPCVDSGEAPVEIDGVTYDVQVCTCPTWEGPYQVGTAIDPSTCVLDSGSGEVPNVWSAAYTPAMGSAG